MHAEKVYSAPGFIKYKALESRIMVLRAKHANPWPEDEDMCKNIYISFFFFI